jgi:hypothetical protein
MGRIRRALRGWLPADPLVREITVILAVKVAALFVLWAAFFSGPDPAADRPPAERILQSDNT